MIIGVIITAALAIIFGGLGAVFLAVHWNTRRKAQRAVNWPQTPGQIVASDLTENYATDSDGYQTTYYQPAIRYVYSVIGVQYTGTRIAYGIASSDRASTLRILARYPLGASVQVYYDPQNPGEAVLETRATGNLLPLVGGIFFLVGVVTGCVGAVLVIATLL